MLLRYTPDRACHFALFFVGEGLVDVDYREIVRVIVTNFSSNKVEFNTKDKITQVLFQKKEDVDFTEVSNLEDHVPERGSGTCDSACI